ncbi:MAG: lytic transglycosylase domain-containing protein [Lachnospiraceae bacterium]|nr:lytic transglycosylase domain-containing protein [Lachnospiraceae bacterium]
MKKIYLLILIAAFLLASITVAAQTGNAPVKVPEDIKEMTEKIGYSYGLCPEILQAIAFYESSFRPEAKNGTCIGLMQINEPFHRERMNRLGVTDLYDPYQSILMAADYIMELKELHHDIAIVLMAYNGFRKPAEYAERTGQISDYASKVLELSAQLERYHGK